MWNRVIITRTERKLAEKSSELIMWSFLENHLNSNFLKGTEELISILVVVVMKNAKKLVI